MLSADLTLCHAFSVLCVIQMGELDALLKGNAAPRESQGKMCAYEAELESQPLEHHMQAGQLKEELERLHRRSLVHHTLYTRAECYRHCNRQQCGGTVDTGPKWNGK